MNNDITNDMINNHLDEYEKSQDNAEEQARARFDAAVQKLTIERNWSKRKATRYLTKMANKELNRLIKQGKARRADLEANGKLIDTSDIKEELDKELNDQLIAAGIDPSTIDTKPAEGVAEEKYEPPTREF
jgi:rRNA pseudouridine-1189 N-methylase Emg1 (Nep1/Mra1 family)